MILLDHPAAVSLDPDVGPANLSELSRIDVDVDDFGIRGEAIELAGDPVIEPGTQRDEQVGLLHRGDGGVVAVHARHAEAEVVAVRKRAASHEGGDHRDLDHLGELHQRLCGPRLQHTATYVEDGSLRVSDHLRGLANQLPVPLQHRFVAGQLHVGVRGDVPVHVRARVGWIDDVLGDVDKHRTRPAGSRDVERLVNDAGDVLGLGDQEVVLGDGHGDARRVALLERVRADRCVWDLAGDAHHRDRVEERVAQRRDDVGGRRATRHNRHTGFAGGVGVALGHVAGTLFVANEDVTDRTVDDRVVDRQDGPARETEHDVDPLVLESLHEGFAAAHLLVVAHGLVPGCVCGRKRGTGKYGPKKRNDLPLWEVEAHVRL